MRSAKHGKLAACTGAQRSLASLCIPWASPKDFANSPVPASAMSQLNTVAQKIVFAGSSSPVLWRRHRLVRFLLALMAPESSPGCAATGPAGADPEFCRLVKARG